ncbi:hypothetical protein EDC04DRAFT_2688455 [Pisolithus marmoratus]|nr:hypothetical protein EDC04DRAFT_2688455 [Pisolithus marmoratus]
MLDPTIYRNAGVTSFKRYIARAAEAGVVLRGGEDDYAWVRLHPDVEMQVNDTYHTSLGASSG